MEKQTSTDVGSKCALGYSSAPQKITCKQFLTLVVFASRPKQTGIASMSNARCIQIFR